MDQSMLERRRDPRTVTFLPISIRTSECDEPKPAHLSDLSFGGAGILTTAYNAPMMGDYVDLEFETPLQDSPIEGGKRREVGIVVNMSAHERGTRRIGVRFIQHPGMGCGLFDPTDLLTSHRQFVDATKLEGSRWETARGFDNVAPMTAGAN